MTTDPDPTGIAPDDATAAPDDATAARDDANPPGVRDDANPPGVRDQLAAVVAAARRLVTAHVELAKTELGAIMGEVGRVAVFAGIAFAMLFLVGLLLPIGLLLLLGDWLFGSMGWGILLGTLLLVDIAVLAGLLAAGIPQNRLGRWFLVALGLGVVLGVLFALDLTNRAWALAGDAVLTGTESGIRPLAMAVLTCGLLGGLVGLVLGARSGSAGGGLTSGAVAGTLIGALTAVAMGPQVGSAVGVLAVLVAWLALAGLDFSRTGIDQEALKARFYPGQTIETTKETIEWLRQRTPLGRKS